MAQSGPAPVRQSISHDRIRHSPVRPEPVRAGGDVVPGVPGRLRHRQPIEYRDPQADEIERERPRRHSASIAHQSRQDATSSAPLQHLGTRSSQHPATSALVNFFHNVELAFAAMSGDRESASRRARSCLSPFIVGRVSWRVISIQPADLLGGAGLIMVFAVTSLAAAQRPRRDSERA